MTNISDVIGWKFNHQPGMRCKEDNGVLKIVEFPGGIPSQADQDTWTAEYNARDTSEERVDQVFQPTDKDRAFFNATFNHENRIRALEGKQPITKAQLKDWFKSQLD